MKYSTSSHLTRSGIQIQIREAKLSDARGLTELIRAYIPSGFIPLSLEEYQPEIEEQENWIRKFLNGENDLLLLAEYQGQLIGNIDLAVNTRRMLSHTGYIGMGVHPDWQQQGIGSLLLEEIIQWGERKPKLEILWLQVFATNIGGRHLYKTKGFIETGHQEKFFKTAEGDYIDNITMTRSV